MRPSAIIAILCCTAATVLSFLCLFAGSGSNNGWLEDYHILTLNTSRIGSDQLNVSLPSGTPSFITNIFNNITDGVQDDINDAIASIARGLGLHDFYSLHVMDWCEGFYTPQAVATATVSHDDINKNVTRCSARSGWSNFNVTSIIQDDINEAGVDITLGDLNWPEDINTGLKALNTAFKAMFICYCIAAALSVIAIVISAIVLFTHGRLSALVAWMVTLLAWLASGIASGVATALTVKGSYIINDRLNDIGVEAYKGNKFLALTWAGTAVLILAWVYWTFEVCFGSSRRRRERHDSYVKGEQEDRY